MGAIISDYWQKVWSQREDAPSREEIRSWLNFYDKRIPHHLLPSPPSTEEVTKAILGSGDSSPGPDGIPFAIYRLFQPEAAPILSAVATSLATGTSPPPEFNQGRLFIIPKSHSPLIDRTRPITVNNTDNRILAKLVASLITPALDFIISDSQKGFIPGRRGGDHIRTLNEQFYSARMKRRQHFILFLDTAKAFDSIDHNFIFEVLAKVGAPTWVINFIHGLFHQVRVFPVLSENTNISLGIWRGVKQGCPLSPLLFALCYDPLLSLLEGIAENTNCAFADDLAVSSNTLSSIIAAMPLIDDFKRVSGLGINTDKTYIISSQVPKQSDHDAVRGAGGPWQLVTFADEVKYLGVLMGRCVTNDDIFRPVLDKFSTRLKASRSVISTLPMHQRIVIINVFFISLFSYLTEFFLIPYDIVQRANALCTSVIVNFGGKSLTHPHLVAHPKRLGLKQPLRDIWASSVARLASQHDLELYHGLEKAEPEEARSYLLKHNFESMLIADHIDAAALEYLNAWCPRLHDKIQVILPADVDGDPNGLESPRRKKIYWHLVDSGYQAERQTDAKGSLPRKLSRWQPTGNPTSALQAQWRHISPSVPSHFITNHFLMLHNATPTERRRAGARMKIITRAGANPCFLCAAPSPADRHIDSLEHLLGHCPVASRARNLFHVSLSLSPPANDVPTSLLLTPFLDKKTTNATISFNFSLISHKRIYFASLSSPPPMEVAARRIARIAITHWGNFAPSKWRSNTSLLSNTLPSTHHPYRPRVTLDDLKTSSTYGSAGNRSPAQEARCREYAAALLAGIPNTAIVAFTDGSARPNPGPCGAGAHIRPWGEAKWSDEAIASLGHGTNNIGELWAIGMAIQLSLTRITSSTTHLYILTDSRFARGILAEDNTPRSQAIVSLSLAVKRMMSTIPSHVALKICWVPAHVGIEDNEHADFLADLGSTASANGRMNVNRQQGVASTRFLPPARDSG